MRPVHTLLVVAIVVAIATTCDSTAEPDFTVGPEGGTLEFRNGVVVVVPPGALAEEVTIEVSDIDTAAAEAMIAHRVFNSPEKRVLGGFVAEPDGLTFAVPITVRVPVRALDSEGGIPVLAEMSQDGQSYSYASSDLTYDSNDDFVELELHHFSIPILVELLNVLVNPPCKSGRMHVVQSATEYATGSGCQISHVLTEVTFFDCPEEPRESDIDDASSGCESVAFEVAVSPGMDFLRTGFDRTLAAAVKVNSVEKEGFPVTWQSMDGGVATVGRDGIVHGEGNGCAEIRAYSPDPEVYGTTRMMVLAGTPGIPACDADDIDQHPIVPGIDACYEDDQWVYVRDHRSSWSAIFGRFDWDEDPIYWSPDGNRVLLKEDGNDLGIVSIPDDNLYWVRTGSAGTGGMEWYEWVDASTIRYKRDLAPGPLTATVPKPSGTCWN